MKQIKIWCKIISQIGKNNELKIIGVIFVFYNPFGDLAFKKASPKNALRHSRENFIQKTFSFF